MAHPNDPHGILRDAEEFLVRAAHDLRAYTRAELQTVLLKLMEFVYAYVTKLIEAIESFAHSYAAAIADIEAHELSPGILAHD